MRAVLITTATQVSLLLFILFTPLCFALAQGSGATEPGAPGTMPPPTTPTTESPTPVPPRGTAVFQPLANLPGLVDTNRTLPQYVNVLFRLAIGIGALIGVVKIIIAGIKYMGTDAYSSKEEAKGDIRNVLVGLLIMLSTWVILTTIYPGIVNLNILNLGKLGAPVYTPRQTPTTPLPASLPVAETPQAHANTAANAGQRIVWSREVKNEEGGAAALNKAMECCVDSGGRPNTSFDNPNKKWVISCMAPPSVQNFACPGN